VTVSNHETRILGLEANNLAQKEYIGKKDDVENQLNAALKRERAGIEARD